MATKHVLPDRLKPGLKLVFCGTAAGRQSALQRAYYAHGQNKFWKTLYEVGLTPNLFQPHDYEKLWELGIGLTDIAKYAYGMDHQLPRAVVEVWMKWRRVKAMDFLPLFCCCEICTARAGLSSAKNPKKH